MCRIYVFFMPGRICRRSVCFFTYERMAEICEGRSTFFFSSRSIYVFLTRRQEQIFRNQISVLRHWKHKMARNKVVGEQVGGDLERGLSTRCHVDNHRFRGKRQKSRSFARCYKLSKREFLRMLESFQDWKWLRRQFT